MSGHALVCMNNMQGIWFGIDLDESKGRSNGTVKHKFYFECRKSHGLFVNHKKLRMSMLYIL